MKINNLYILTLLSLFFMVSCKDDEPTGTIIIDPEDQTDSVFVYVDPNINDGVIDFEEFGPSFEDDTKEDAERSNGGNWSEFGGTEGATISIEYADNPDKSEPNTSDKVLKVTEPELTNEWAGFYFKLEEGMNFPVGKEAIKVDIWSPTGTQVSIKLEDELKNGSDGKKDTGDIFATKQQDGWESLVFNIPDGKLENGVYNTFVIIMTRFETAAGVSYLDNIDFSTPAEVIIPDAPTTAPAAAPAIFCLVSFPLEAPNNPPAKAPIVLPELLLHFFFDIFTSFPLALILFKLGEEPATPLAVTFNHVAGASAAFKLPILPKLRKLKTDKEVIAILTIYKISFVLTSLSIFGLIHY